MACMQASALPAGARAGICRASQQQAEKRKNIRHAIGVMFPASLGCMHPTLQVRTDRLLGPHPGLLEAALRAYTQQAFM